VDHEVTHEHAVPFRFGCASNARILHGAGAEREKGAVVNGRGDTPNMHDILTGSQPDGKAFPPGNDMTCKNWTSSTPASASRLHDVIPSISTIGLLTNPRNTDESSTASRCARRRPSI
jgi:hypothetical protein